MPSGPPDGVTAWREGWGGRTGGRTISAVWPAWQGDSMVRGVGRGGGGVGPSAPSGPSDGATAL